MNGPMMMDQSSKLQSSELDSFINMLWDQDVDMGVDRQLYDPVLRENELKKQQAEQTRLLQIKKKQAQQEMMYFTIDEETGERIPKSSAGPYQPPAEFTDELDFTKDLAELGEIANLNYLLGDTSPAQDSQSKPDNSMMQQADQPSHNNFNDIIIQTADQPNPFSDLDMWPTEITMLPGSPQDNLSDLSLPSTSDELDVGFMSQLWQSDKTHTTSSTSAGAYNGYGGKGEVHSQYQPYNEVSTSQDIYKSSMSTNNTFYNRNTFLDSLNHDSGEQHSMSSGQSFKEDIKPYFLFNNQGSSGSQNNDSGSSSASSGYAGSENDDDSMSKSEQERERRSICRDELKCKELAIPFGVEMITNYPVEEFNSLLRMHRLSEEQLTVIKDIRRRGKNKVAAQNCRKKKLNELTGLEVEINDLKRKRSDLVRDKDDMKRSKLHLRKQLDETYAEVFNSVRDHLGRPYDPHFYTLHISDDGDARIIPNKVNTYAMLNYQQSA